MSAREIVEVVGELVIDDGETLEQQHGSRALMVARDMEDALAPRLQENEMQAMIWRQFRNAPQARASYLLPAIEELLSADAALARRLEDLLEEYRRATQQPTAQRIDTGGGAYIGGGVTVSGGRFAGRDQVNVEGDAAIARDQASATVSRPQGLGGQDLAALFDRIYERIESRPPDPDVDKEEMAETVRKIQQEAAKGEEANPRKVERWLRTLGMMAGDIVDVTAACLLSPAAGVAAVIRKVAQKAQEDASS